MGYILQVMTLTGNAQGTPVHSDVGLMLLDHTHMAVLILCMYVYY